MAKRNIPNKIFNPIELELGKIPSQAVEVEEAILGAIIVDGISAVDKVTSILKTESFYKDEHQKIFQAILELHLKDKAIDLLTITEKLRVNKQLEEVGGPLYITQLTDRRTFSANIEEHALIVQQKFIQREIVRITSEIQSNAFDDSIDVKDLLDYFNKLHDELNELSAGKQTIRLFSDVLEQSISEALERKKNAIEGRKIGIEPPLKSLKEKICYWVNDLILVAARPSEGKTNLALHIAKEAALNKCHVCIYSLETDAVKLSDRLLIAEARINDIDYRSGHITDADILSLQLAKKNLSTLPIYIDDNPVASVDYIRSHSRIMRKKGKCDMIIIDYIQLADTSQYKRMTRDQEISIISRGLKTNTRQLQIPTIALCQMNREIEKRTGDKKPKLSDLRDGGSLEMDSFMVLFLWRPERYGIYEDEKGINTKGTAYLIIAKNKDGPTGEVKFKQKYGLRYIWDIDETQPEIRELSGKDKQMADDNPFLDDDTLPF